MGGVFGSMLDPLLRTVLKKSRATHRAARDAIDKAARKAQVDDIARRQGVPPSSLPRAKPYNHNVSKNTNPAVAKGRADPAEVARQKDLYQNGMNSQTVDDAMARVTNKPRRPKSTAERNLMRKELKQQAYRDLRKEGCSPAEAKKWASQYADEQFPRGPRIPQPMLHNPDMNLGGPTPTHTYGDSAVNNALGQSAKSERNNFLKYLQDEHNAGRGDHLVNVNLT